MPAKMVNDTMYVRQMTEADWPQVAAIYEQGIVSHKATFAQKAPEYAVWDAEHHPHTRLVAETSDGIIAGWVAVAPSFARAVYNGVAEISIYIHDDFKHQGVGTMLLEAAAEESEKNGIWTLEALIFADNEPSLKLFRKCGYVDLGVRKRLGYDTVLEKWRDVAMLERRSPNI
ncbi:MAG: N-acetyltransferase [Peptococcaceae bacterium]|nr:N-acetyltransferase [Peptococcaceae bacterium]MBQ2836852.1 N-acetyltransferase [Peptococcaceae bacterium]MBQ2905535.1 N-acetyltransferase [Peptococcaceae bacterium]MBQ3205053.1 N-acetyltransferase [Peptococcaceae bacterium]MBQ6853788.1 N-acetyltransferase [Peptococcaceae bacterium]